jgi:hypothetical protein
MKQKFIERIHTYIPHACIHTYMHTGRDWDEEVRLMSVDGRRMNIDIRASMYTYIYIYIHTYIHTYIQGETGMRK